MSLKCLIVDDEPPAHKVLENYIAKLDSLSLAGNCYNAIEALNLLHQESIDLVFLDINMPELSGLDMLRTLSNPPLIILTTAYSEFALEGFELGVTDYLVKPIRFDRFLKSVNRVLKIRQNPMPLKQDSNMVEKESFFFVKADGIQHKIWFEDLHYIQSKGNFVQLHLRTKKILTAETLSRMDNKLSPHGFLRVHKSYIINCQKVRSLQGNQISIGEELIPIGNSYKQVVIASLKIP